MTSALIFRIALIIVLGVGGIADIVIAMRQQRKVNRYLFTGLTLLLMSLSFLRVKYATPMALVAFFGVPLCGWIARYLTRPEKGKRDC